MYLDENETTNTNPSQGTPEIPVDNQIKPTDIFIRDLSCWYQALLKRWWWIVVSAVFFCAVFFAYRFFLVDKTYSSSCALVRQEVADVRHSDLPINYSPVQLSVMFNMIRGHICLSETARRLNLHLTHEQMFNIITVRQAEKNSNYFFISAIARDPKMAADMANTLAQVFLDEYKKMIRNNIEDTYENSSKSMASYKSELDSLQIRMSELYVDAIRRRISELEIQLSNTVPEVVVYSEKSSTGDQKLTEARLKLESMMQSYTEKNPMVEKQRLLIANLEQEAQKNNEALSKVVSGRNQEYVAISTELNRTKSELAAAEKSMRGEGESLVALRINLELLNTLTPQMNNLRDQITRKKDQLMQQELVHKKLQSFLDRSYSDVAIREEAQPPLYPMPRKVVIFTLIGLVLGGLLGTFAVLSIEAANLSIRSRTDVVNALHLNFLGGIPAFNGEDRAEYYSALQEAIAAGKDFLVPVKDRPVFILVIPPNSVGKTEEAISKDLLELLYVKENLNCMVIKNLEGDDLSEKSQHLVNDMLYGLSDELPPSAANGKTWYYNLNDLAFLSPPSKEQLDTFEKRLNSYDVVIWETFSPEKHWQLFSDLLDHANMLIIPMRFATTSKVEVLHVIERLGSERIEKVFGLLYDIKKIHRKVKI